MDDKDASVSQAMQERVYNALCIGAGPAGLTAGYLLGKQGKSCLVLEKDAHYVGGISKTVQYKGFRFDIGGHRFFSKSSEIQAIWEDILGSDLIERPRKSRIFYRKKFFSYPLKPVEALFKLGFYSSLKALVSYFKYRLHPIKPVKSFQDWVTNHFGNYFFQIFFKTYTEKVWGMKCSEISPDWAAQRIKGLSLTSAIKNAFYSTHTKNSQQIKTLITHFRYPRLGPGMMWEEAQNKIQQHGNRVVLDACVTGLDYDESQKLWQIEFQTSRQKKTAFAEQVISSMPLKELIHTLAKKPPDEIIDAANALKYRDFLMVALMINHEGNFDDNWIYIHDPFVKVGRVQNFRSWSPELIPGEGMNCYGMEYFCFAGDGLWTSADDVLIEQAKNEIMHIGLANRDEIFDGCVIRQPKAYPVYDEKYKHNVAIIRDYLQQHYPALHLVGRNGMHKYNNQDHAMMTAKLTVENIIHKARMYDIWAVNEDAEYHETNMGRQQVTKRLVPEKAS